MKSTSLPIDLCVGSGRGLILVDADATVLDMNFTAKDILERTTELRIESGRLRATREFGLAELIQRACIEDAGGFAVAVDDANGTSRPLFLLGLRACVDGADRRTREAAVALIVNDLEAAVRPNQHLLRFLFGLTPRECAVATILMNGRAPSNVCAELHITPNTVRGHLKTLMSKTGATRQGQLVRLLLCSLALACPPSLTFQLEDSKRAGGITIVRLAEQP